MHRRFAAIGSGKKTSRSGRYGGRQEGGTTLGFLFLAAFVGLCAFATIRLTPTYLNYLKVIGIVDGVFEEFDGQNASRADIRRSIVRRYSVESVNAIEVKDFTVTQSPVGFVVDCTYNHETAFIGNVAFLVHFSKTAEIRR